MREGVSNIWLIGIIVLFISIFASYIAITINYTSSFKIKNEVLSIIEKHKGMTSSTGHEEKSKITNENITVGVGALQTINLYLRGRAYTSTGQCPQDGNTWYGVPELKEVSELKSFSGNLYEPAQSNKKYYYCFARFNNEAISGYDSAYYKVRLFYKLEFPALSEFLSIKVEGLTDEIYDPQDKDKFTSNSNIYS